MLFTLKKKPFSERIRTYSTADEKCKIILTFLIIPLNGTSKMNIISIVFKKNPSFFFVVK